MIFSFLFQLALLWLSLRSFLNLTLRERRQPCSLFASFIVNTIFLFLVLDFSSVVLQLCYNQLTGSIPTQLGSLKKLTVLALQSNQLTGAIPASLGDVEMLMRLDLSFNNLFGSIPTKVADAPLLEVLDIRNNSLSGSVPLGNVSLNFPL